MTKLRALLVLTFLASAGCTGDEPQLDAVVYVKNEMSGEYEVTVLVEDASTGEQTVLAWEELLHPDMTLTLEAGTDLAPENGSDRRVEIRYIRPDAAGGRAVVLTEWRLAGSPQARWTMTFVITEPGPILMAATSQP